MKTFGLIFIALDLAVSVLNNIQGDTLKAIYFLLLATFILIAVKEI